MKRPVLDNRTRDFFRAMAFLAGLLLLLVIFGRCTSYPFNCSPSWFTTCDSKNDKNLEYIISARMSVDRLWRESQTARAKGLLPEDQFLLIVSSLNNLTSRLSSTQQVVEWGKEGLIDKRSVKEFMSALREHVQATTQSVQFSLNEHGQERDQ